MLGGGNPPAPPPSSLTLPPPLSDRTYQQSLHEDMGFTADSMQLLRDWNGLDTALLAWGGALLNLDAAFHTAAAALTGGIAEADADAAAEAAALITAPSSTGSGANVVPSAAITTIDQVGLPYLCGQAAAPSISCHPPPPPPVPAGP